MGLLSKQQWRSFYEKEAASYDRTRYGTRYGMLFKSLHREALKRLLPSPDGTRALDVAAGTGHLTHLLAQRGFQVTAVDLTWSMLRGARGKLSQEGLRADFFIADAIRLPFAAGSFDLVGSTRFLHLWPPERQEEVVSEMARVLRPGGTLVIDFDNWWHKTLLSVPILVYQKCTQKGRRVGEHYNRFRATTRMLQSAGFEVEQVLGVGSYLLYPLALVSRRLAAGLGRAMAAGPMRLLSEQFILRGRKVETPIRCT